MIKTMICFTPRAIQLTAYFYAAMFLLIGVIVGVIIMKIRFNRKLKRMNNETKV